MLNASFSKVPHGIGENYGSEAFYDTLLLTAHLTNMCLCHISLISLRFATIFVIHITHVF
jgi:hypothetical protein